MELPVAFMYLLEILHYLLIMALSSLVQCHAGHKFQGPAVNIVFFNFLVQILLLFAWEFTAFTQYLIYETLSSKGITNGLWLNTCPI